MDAVAWRLSPSLSSCAAAYQYEMNHQCCSSLFTPALWSIVSPINIQLPRAGLITWERGRRRFRKVTYVQWRLTVAGPSIGRRWGVNAAGGSVVAKLECAFTGWRWTFSCRHQQDGKHFDMSWCLQGSEWSAGWFFWRRSFLRSLWRLWRDVETWPEIVATTIAAATEEHFCSS